MCYKKRGAVVPCDWFDYPNYAVVALFEILVLRLGCVVLVMRRETRGYRNACVNIPIRHGCPRRVCIKDSVGAKPC